MAKWLDKYEQGGMVLKQKTHDNYGKKPNPNDVQASVGPDFVGLGYNTKGRDYSPAWGGQFQNGGFLQPNDWRLPSGVAIPNKADILSSELATSIGGEDGEPAYLIPSFKGGKRVNALKEYQKTGEYLGGPFKTWQEADKWEQEIRHPYVEKGQPIPIPLKTWGDMQMGGSMPGAVGFTYARTQDPAPSNGKYAKKTLASAQNGKKVDPNEKKYQAPDKNKIVDWFNNYYTSPFFKENLYDKGNAFMENVGDHLGKATAEKINNLDYTFKDVNSAGYYQGTAYDLGNTINMGNPNNYYNQSKSDVLAHELGHVNQDVILGQQPRNLAIMLNYNNQVNRKPLANDIYNMANEMPPKNTYGELLYPHLPSVGSYRADRLKDWVSDENRRSTGEFHDHVLGEVRGDIMALRYLASKEGIWDAAKNKPGSFTPEMLDKLYKSKNLNTPQVKKDSQVNITTNEPNPKSLKPNDLKNVAPPKKPGMILNRLREKYNDSDLLYLMNKLAKNEENAPMDKAQNGKEMSFYQNGLDWKPKTISKNGSKVIKDNMGQWSHPGEVTEISGNTMATHGYGDVPLYVVPDKGSPRIVQANTGTQKFPGATKFTEYPMAQDGENISKKLKKQAEESIAKRNANRPTMSQYTPKKGEAERLEKEKAQRREENSALLNRAASSKYAANAMNNLIEPGFDLYTLGEGALAAKALAKPALEAAGKYLTEETALKNAHKLNPYAFKPTEGMMYRGIGEGGMQDALGSGVFRAKQDVQPIMRGNFDMSKQFSKPYFSPSFETADRYGNGFIAEVPKDATTWGNRYSSRNTWSQIAQEDIPIDKGKILKKNWLKGYKEVPKPTSTQRVTRGPINWWDEPKYKKQNPNFDPQTYLNNPVGNQFYSKDIPKGMEPRYFEDNKNGGWLNKYK